MAENTISPKIEKIIDNPCMSQKALSGITFSSDDRQFIKRQFDGVYEFLKDKNTENQRYLAEIIIDNNTAVFKRFDTINDRLQKYEEKIFEVLQKQEEKVSDALKLQEIQVNNILQKQLVNEKNILDTLHNQDEKLGDILNKVEKNIININTNISKINNRLIILNKRYVKLETRVTNIEKILNLKS
jgi:small-conductance mechanosensitive channel